MRLLQASLLASLAITVAGNPVPLALLDDATILHLREEPTQNLEDSAPTVEDCKTQLNVPQGSSFFYSGPGGIDYTPKVLEVLNSQNRPYLRGYHRLEDSFIDFAWRDKWAADPRSQDFWENCSQAMAELSSGVVYVLLEEGPWRPASVWARKEWPNLITNRKVTRVTRVTPSNRLRRTVYTKAGGVVPNP